MNETCEYCSSKGVLRLSSSEVGTDVFVCDMHWSVLKDPTTAMPFIRGFITMKLRGTMPSSYLERFMDSYMSKIIEITKTAKQGPRFDT